MSTKTTETFLCAALLAIGILGRADAAEPAAANPLPPDAAAKEPVAITRTTVIPCPTPKPAFDHTKIDRTLKEPKYVSKKPAYRFFAFGPEGKSVMAMVLDESQGTGKGYDVLYIDLNLDRDITAADEKFACKSAAVPTKAVVPERLECAVPAGGESCPLPDAESAPVPAAIWIINSAPADFLLRPAIQRGLTEVRRRGLTYDLLIKAPQLEQAVRCVERQQGLRFVLDHGGKPDIRRGALRPWAAGLAVLAQHPHVACKLSGLVTETDPTAWTPAELEPYVRTILDTFGPRRVLFGSDWPVCLLGTSHRRWLDTVRGWIAAYPASDQAAILGGNALTWYRTS